MFTPLHQHFVEWYDSLESEQQILVRKILTSIYYHEVSDMAHITLQSEDVDGQIRDMLDDFVETGDLQGMVGDYLCHLIQEDQSIQSFSDILVQLSEGIEPINGSTTNENVMVADAENLTIDQWRKRTYDNIAADVAKLFPDQSDMWAKEWQQKRVLKRSADLETKIKQGARINFDRGHLY